MVHTLLIQSNFLSRFWVDASFTTIFLLSRLPTSVLHGLSPFEKLYGSHPDYSNLCVFECSCFPNLTPYTHHKLEPRSKHCVFLDCALNYKGYWFFDPLTNQLYTSHHVHFIEYDFPYARLTASSLTIPDASSHPLVIPLFVPLHFESSSRPCSTDMQHGGHQALGSPKLDSPSSPHETQ